MDDGDLGDVVAPIGIETAVTDQHTELQDGFVAGKAPAGSGDVEPVGNQVTADAFDTPVAMGQSTVSVRS
ncbi:hypothetical protein [Streptomyces rimosus]|uniref:hypothetical protein n=1 Tax=Streptomyces rimosus TaxID=1927 RepID=UPI00131CA0CE